MLRSRGGISLFGNIDSLGREAPDRVAGISSGYPRDFAGIFSCPRRDLLVISLLPNDLRMIALDQVFSVMEVSECT